MLGGGGRCSISSSLHLGLILDKHHFEDKIIGKRKTPDPLTGSVQKNQEQLSAEGSFSLLSVKPWQPSAQAAV